MRDFELDEVRIRMVEEFKEQIKEERLEHDSHSLYWARYYDDALGEVYDRGQLRHDDTMTVVMTEDEKKKLRESRTKLVQNKMFRMPLTEEALNERIEEWLEKNKKWIQNRDMSELKRIMEINKKPKNRCFISYHILNSHDLKCGGKRTTF